MEVEGIIQCIFAEVEEIAFSKNGLQATGYFAWVASFPSAEPPSQSQTFILNLIIFVLSSFPGKTW